MAAMCAIGGRAFRKQSKCDESGGQRCPFDFHKMIWENAMKLPRRNFLHLAAGAAALPFVSRTGWAQAYPTRPVKIVAGFPAGGASDVNARMIMPCLSEKLGQQFIVENRVGATGTLGAAAVVRSAPDGYTLLLMTTP
jgi:hypothetical protein